MHVGVDCCFCIGLLYTYLLFCFGFLILVYCKVGVGVGVGCALALAMLLGGLRDVYKVIAVLPCVGCTIRGRFVFCI